MGDNWGIEASGSPSILRRMRNSSGTVAATGLTFLADRFVLLLLLDKHRHEFIVHRQLLLRGRHAHVAQLLLRGWRHKYTNAQVENREIVDCQRKFGYTLPQRSHKSARRVERLAPDIRCRRSIPRHAKIRMHRSFRWHLVMGWSARNGGDRCASVGIRVANGNHLVFVRIVLHYAFS